MTLILILIPLVFLILVVEIATIALHMTGLDIKSARFQALSSFSLTGFTTKEAEEVVNHRQRRKIIMVLMVLGLITWATLISFIVNAIINARQLIPSLVQIAVILSVLLFMLLLARHRPFIKAFRNKVAQYLEHRTPLKGRSIDEILRLAEDYGVAQISLGKDSKNVGLTLKETNLRERDILVLAIERDKKIIPAPHANDILKEDDVLICYGKLKNMQELL